MRDLWKKIQLPGKIALSAVILWLLATKIDWAEMGAVFQRARYGVLLGSFGVLEVQQCLMVVTWYVVLRRVSRTLGLWPVLYSHVVGNFWGTLLPTTLGIDVIRAFSLRKFGVKTSDAATTLFVTRVLGFASLFLLAGSAAFFPSSRSVLYQFGPAVLVSFALFLSIFPLMLWPSLLKPFQRVAERIRFHRLAKLIGEVRDSLISVFGGRLVIVGALGLSVLYQLLGVYVVYLLGTSLRAGAPFAAYLFVVPAVTIITAIPISFAGLGVREASFVVLLGQLGVSGEKALSISLLFFLQALFLAFQGGLFYWVARSERQPLPSALPEEMEEIV